MSTLWHCGIDGMLTSEALGASAASGQDSFEYDPEDPCPTLGGNNCCGAPTIAGPKDQRPIEARSDVLSYTSIPLVMHKTTIPLNRTDIGDGNHQYDYRLDRMQTVPRPKQ